MSSNLKVSNNFKNRLYYADQFRADSKPDIISFNTYSRAHFWKSDFLVSPPLPPPSKNNKDISAEC